MEFDYTVTHKGKSERRAVNGAVLPVFGVPVCINAKGWFSYLKVKRMLNRAKRHAEKTSNALAEAMVTAQEANAYFCWGNKTIATKNNEDNTDQD